MPNHFGLAATATNVSLGANTTPKNRARRFFSAGAAGGAVVSLMTLGLPGANRQFYPFPVNTMRATCMFPAISRPGGPGAPPGALRSCPSLTLGADPNAIRGQEPKAVGCPDVTRSPGAGCLRGRVRLGRALQRPAPPADKITDCGGSVCPPA